MTLEIIMYHYVRNNEDYDYDCFCRRKDEFVSQINFFNSLGEIVDTNDKNKIKFFLENNNSKGYMLTFDDGYKDHKFCAEFLGENNLNGCFFPPINIFQKELLDVNAIHLLIGSRNVKSEKLLNEIINICRKKRLKITSNKKIVDIDYYIKNYHEIRRFDDQNILIIKSLLQRDILLIKERKDIIDKLIDKYIKIEKKELAKNLYLNFHDLNYLKNIGMTIGSHGFTHQWFRNLNFQEQKSEIKKSFEYLEDLELIKKNELKYLCFPYGSYNLDTFNIMHQERIDYGLTTKVGSARIEKKLHSKFCLKRWDTNDFWDSNLKEPKIPNFN